jgi:hypothetical protein
MPIGDVLHGIFRLNERLGPAREIRGSRFSQAGGGSFLDSDRAHIASFGCVRLSCLFSIFTVTHVLHCNAWAVQNSWMTGDPERDNCPDLVNCSDPSEKSNERVRTDGRPAREISNVIAQESLPALRRRTASPDHVSCNGRFAYVDPEHQQFAVDARCAPRRILPAHSADQRAQLAVDPGPAATPPRLPAPIRSEPAPMPTKHSFRLYNDNGVHHDGNSRDSQTKIRPSMFRKRTPASRLAAQHQQLLAKNEDLRLARGTSSKSGTQGEQNPT